MACLWKKFKIITFFLDFEQNSVLAQGATFIDFTALYFDSVPVSKKNCLTHFPKLYVFFSAIYSNKIYTNYFKKKLMKSWKMSKIFNFEKFLRWLLSKKIGCTTYFLEWEAGGTTKKLNNWLHYKKFIWYTSLPPTCSCVSLFVTQGEDCPR